MALGNFLPVDPDLDGNGTADCLDSFAFTATTAPLTARVHSELQAVAGSSPKMVHPGPYSDGLVAGSFNHFGASDSYIRPNDVHAIPESETKSVDVIGHYDVTDTATVFFEAKYNLQEITSIEQYHNFTDLLHGLPDNPFLPESLAALADNAGAGFADIGRRAANLH